MRSWVVGRGGLLGASVEEACAARGTVHRPAVALPWGASADLHERLREESAAFFASIGDDPWMVLWCAGRGTLAATDDDMAADTAALDALLTGIEAACPAPARERGIVFHASSVGGLYAGSTSPPFTEFTEPAPTTPYGRAKLIQEQRLAAWAPRAGVRVLIGRISNLYGARQDLAKNQGLISTLCASILRRRPINLFVPLETSRNYIHVADAARVALDAAALLLADDAPGRVTVKLIVSEENVTIASLLGTAGQLTRVRPLVTLGGGARSAPQPRNIHLRSVVLPQADAHPKLSIPVGMKRVMMEMEAQYFRHGWAAPPR